MPFIVQILYPSPSMNTCSQKKIAQQNPMGHQFAQGDINSRHYFFTLPNTIDNNSFIVAVATGLPNLGAHVTWSGLSLGSFPVHIDHQHHHHQHYLCLTFPSCWVPPGVLHRPPGSAWHIIVWSSRLRSWRSCEPQRGKKEISRAKGVKERDKEDGKSGLIQKRVDKESRIGKMGTHLEKPRTEAKGN